MYVILKRLSIVASLAVGLVGATTTSAHAGKCDDKQEDAKPTKNYKIVKGPDGRKVFVMENVFVVCGIVPKPNVIYVLQATTINYEWENLKQDFLPNIRLSVKKAPF